MKTFDQETEKRLADAKARRDRKIYQLTSLYKRWCSLTGKRFRKDDLDEMINKRYQVEGGLSALTFASADEVIAGLEESIGKIEKIDG